MPYDEPDPSDPNILMGVALPGDEASVREMAIAFAEEFALLGFDEQRLMALFRHPFYAGANLALRILGEAEIRVIVRESAAFWGRYRVVVEDSRSSAIPCRDRDGVTPGGTETRMQAIPPEEESCRE